MRVSLVRSGGVHGIRRTAELDTETLDRERADELRQLVWAADLSRIGEPTINVAADRFRYTLTVDEAGHRETLTFAEDRVPSAVRPLVELLWRNAEERPEPPAGIKET